MNRTTPPQNAAPEPAADERPGPGDALRPPPGADWLTGTLARLLASVRIETAWHGVVEAFRSFGLAHVLYGHSPDSRRWALGSAEDFLVLSTLPRPVMAEMVSNGYHMQSATFNQALRRPGVISWSMPHADLPPEVDFRQSPAALAFFDRVGMAAGCTIGFPTGQSRGAAAMGLIAPRGIGQADFDRWLPQVAESLFVLGTVSHRVLSGLPWQRPTGTLTPRQREVLEWVAEGKTTADIACILGLTPATVEKHLRLARQCLGVETTAQALVKAGFLNQLFRLGEAAPAGGGAG